MDREYADNKSNTGNSARISEMEQGELSYFLKLFEYLRDALNNAPTSFMSRGKRMVDVDECLNILNDMYNTLPVAMRGASKVYREQENIVRGAKAEEMRILESANARAKNQLENANARADGILRAAQERAESTVANAEAKASRMLDEARAQAEEMVSETEIMQKAREEARTTVNQALAEASDKRLAAAGYADGLLDELDKLLTEMGNHVRSKRSELAE